MAKLPRKALMHFIDASFGSGTPSWFLIGRDVEELSVEMNGETESKTNILDETTTEDKGFKPSFDVDPYYADPDDGDWYNAILDITMNRKTGGARKTKLLEVIVDSTEGSGKAWMEDVVVTPTNYGGVTGGVAIPYKVDFDGNRKEGTAKITNKVPTFTEAAG